VSSRVLKGKRQVFWKDKGGYVPINIYDGERLQPGNVVLGPAVIEFPTTTMTVLPDQRAKADEYGNFVIERGEDA